MTVRDLVFGGSGDCGGSDGSSFNFDPSLGVVGGEGLLRPQERLLPASFNENFEVDFGSGGIGMLLNGLSCGDLHSSFLAGKSVEDAVVEAALNREDLSVVVKDAGFEDDPPLALQAD